jgi:hypothetical protein
MTAAEYAEAVAVTVRELNQASRDGWDGDPVREYLADALDSYYEVSGGIPWVTPGKVRVHAVRVVVTVGGPYADLRNVLGSDVVTVHAAYGGETAEVKVFAPAFAGDLAALAYAWEDESGVAYLAVR